MIMLRSLFIKFRGRVRAEVWERTSAGWIKGLGYRARIQPPGLEINGYERIRIMI